ncbi:MAG: hypothetical protein Q9195_005479 [Heterodermia aff. obscurata]
MHPEEFKASLLSSLILGFSQSGPPKDEDVSSEGQRELSSPARLKEAPPAGQSDRFVGINNKAAEGPANNRRAPAHGDVQTLQGQIGTLET